MVWAAQRLPEPWPPNRRCRCCCAPWLGSAGSPAADSAAVRGGRRLQHDGGLVKALPGLCSGPATVSHPASPTSPEASLKIPFYRPLAHKGLQWWRLWMSLPFLKASLSIPCSSRQMYPLLFICVRHVLRKGLSYWSVWPSHRRRLVSGGCFAVVVLAPLSGRFLLLSVCGPLTLRMFCRQG